MDQKKVAESSINVYKPDVEAFTKLWSNLRTFYEGTNVTKTIARLLHIYQPEDGILVYARLLRTLYVMLQNFEPKGFCTLASMVPPPKGASEATIEKVFYDTTGHYRLNVPVLRFNNNAYCTPLTSESQTQCKKDTKHNYMSVESSNTKSPAGFMLKKPINENNLPLKKRKTLFLHEFQNTNQDTVFNKCNIIPSSQTISSVPNRPSHMLQLNLQKPSSSVSQPGMKWIQVSTQKKLPPIKSAWRLEVSNKIVSTQNNLTSISNSSKVEETLTNQCELELQQKPMVLNNNTDTLKKSNGKNKEESFQFFHTSTYKQTNNQEKKLYRAICKDIHSMDYVRSDSDDYSLPCYEDARENPFEIQENLNQSLKNFLKRIKNGKQIITVVPEFPKTQPIARAQNFESSKNMTTKETKVFKSISIERKIVKESSTLNKIFSSNNNQIKTKEILQNRSMRRKRPEPPTRPRSERVAQRNLLSQNANGESKTNLLPTKRTRNSKEKQCSVLNNISDSDLDTTMNIMPNKYPSMEISAYKKQYCDALMSIQRAKVAVANSLAISSVTGNPGCYPYYVNYFNRQQHMMQQQLNMNPYCQNNWRFQSYGQYRMPQPAHTMYCAMNTTSQKYPLISNACIHGVNNPDKFSNTKETKLEQTMETYLKNCSDGTENTLKSYQ